MGRKTGVAEEDCKIGHDQVRILVEGMGDMMAGYESKNVVQEQDEEVGDGVET